MGEEFQTLTNSKLLAIGLILFIGGLLLIKNENQIKQPLEKKALANLNYIEDTIPVNLVQGNKVNEFIPDTTINNKIILENSLSISNICPLWHSVKSVEKIRETPVVIFYNKDKKQYLLAYKYEGNIENHFSCFEFGYLMQEDFSNYREVNITNEQYFETESGLKLGLTYEEIVNIKGPDFLKKEDGENIFLLYSMNNYQESSFLKSYKMPGYFIDITLENNRAVKITFGFDYP